MDLDWCCFLPSWSNFIGCDVNNVDRTVNDSLQNCKVKTDSLVRFYRSFFNMEDFQVVR